MTLASAPIEFIQGEDGILPGDLVALMSGSTGVVLDDGLVATAKWRGVRLQPYHSILSLVARRRRAVEPQVRNEIVAYFYRY